MYLEFYGLTEKPFSQTPDPRFLYWNDGYRETIASLTYGIRERKGFVTMIGEAGTGKTTLLRKLLDDLGSEVLSVFLFNPNATFEEILEYTLSELGIAVPSGRKLAMLQRLNEFLLAAFAEGRNTILIIDEAQDLDSGVLENLRLLSNLETSQEKILQIVLSGQPELAVRLAEPGLRQLKQRIAVRCRLDPLRREELGQYIGARLAVVGGRPDLFSPETLDPIWDFAQGIPRLINMVCDNALLVGYALGRRPIDRAVVDEVIGDLRRLDVEFGSEGASFPPTKSPEAPPTIVAPPRPVIEPAVSVRAEPPPGEPLPTAAAAPRAPVADAAISPPSPGQRAEPYRFPSQRQARPFETPPLRGRELRWLGGAVAALVLVGLGGALTLWAQRSTREPIEAPRRDDRVIGEAESRAAAPAEASSDRGSTAGPTVASATVAVEPPSGDRTDGGRAEQAADSAARAEPVQVANAPDTDGAKDPSSEPEPTTRATAAPARAPEARVETAVQVARIAPPAGDVAPEPRAAGAPEAPSGEPAAGPQARKLVAVRSGDTLSNLATRAYGRANYTTLDMLRARNPGIGDIDRILKGASIEFPDPGPASRILQRDDGIAVLVLTTPQLVEALAIQESLGKRYDLPIELRPMELGKRRDLYRVSIRPRGGPQEALEIARNLGSILEDPGT